MSEKHPFPVPVVNKKAVGSVVRNDLLRFRSGSYSGKVLVPVPAPVPTPLFPESWHLIFDFFTFVLQFYVRSGPKSVLELKCFTVPVPLRQKATVPAVPVTAPAPQNWLLGMLNNDKTNLSGELDQNNALSNKCFLEANYHTPNRRLCTSTKLLHENMGKITAISSKI
jgi:hypothetical protein